MSFPRRREVAKTPIHFNKLVALKKQEKSWYTGKWEKKDSEVRPSDRPDGRDAERVFKNSWCWFYFQPFQDMSIENQHAWFSERITY